MLLACTDEFHQLYSLNRGPRLFDVIVDTLGVISGVIFTFIFIKIIEGIYKKYRKEKNLYDQFKTNNRGKNCKNS